VTESLRVTTVGPIVEMEGHRLVVTTVGVIVEMELTRLMATTVGAIVEMEMEQQIAPMMGWRAWSYPENEDLNLAVMPEIGGMMIRRV